MVNRARLSAMVFALGLALGPLTAGPLLAEETQPMTPDACAASWAALLAAFDMPARYGAGAPQVTDSGWCRIDRSTTDLDDNDFASLIWRGEGLQQAARDKVPPRQLEALFLGVPPFEPIGRFSGLGTLAPEAAERPRGTLHIAYTLDPAARSMTVEDIQLDYGPEGFFRASGRLSGIDFSSPAAMQFTLGAGRLREARLVADLRGALARMVWAGRDTSASDQVDFVFAIPADAIDTESRAALLDWANAMPLREGRLELSALADPGLGALQIGAAIANANPLDRAGMAPADVLPILLSGVTLTASWTPAE